MKTIIFLALVIAQTAYAQTFSESITRELAFEKKSASNALVVANIFGSVKVVAYDGDNIQVEVKKSITAKTEARLEKGKEEVQLGIIDRADTLILFVYDGCHEYTREGKTGSRNNWKRKDWGYQTKYEKCRMEYDYRMDFVVKIPSSVHLELSTINDGDLIIENATGIVEASNINGSIRLTNVVNKAKLHTINGNVDVEYARNPGKDCSFYTLNGDINAYFPPGLSAKISFESFNGSFYTNIAKMETLPAKVEKASDGNGVKYKISDGHFQVGSGGSLLAFETFNGNVYLKEKRN